ncbi:ARMD4 protein, partial [Atractosteus spatula]|nr:ARMD4 protein [Atractosteus spatula]
MECSMTLRLLLLAWWCALAGARPVQTKELATPSRRDGDSTSKGGQPLGLLGVGSPMVGEKKPSAAVAEGFFLGLSSISTKPTPPSIQTLTLSAEKTSELRIGFGGGSKSRWPTSQPALFGGSEVSHQTQGLKAGLRSSGLRVESSAFSPTPLYGERSGMPTPAVMKDSGGPERGGASLGKAALDRYQDTPAAQAGKDDSHSHLGLWENTVTMEAGESQFSTPIGSLNQVLERRREDGPGVGRLAQDRSQKNIEEGLGTLPSEVESFDATGSNATGVALSESLQAKNWESDTVRTVGAKIVMTTSRPFRLSTAGQERPRQAEAPVVSEGRETDLSDNMEATNLDVPGFQGQEEQESDTALLAKTGNSQHPWAQYTDGNENEEMPSERERKTGLLSYAKLPSPTGIHDRTQNKGTLSDTSEMASLTLLDRTPFFSHSTSSTVRLVSEVRLTVEQDESQHFTSLAPELRENRATIAPSSPRPNLSLTSSSSPGLTASPGESLLQASTYEDPGPASSIPTVHPTGGWGPSNRLAGESWLAVSAGPQAEDLVHQTGMAESPPVTVKVSAPHSTLLTTNSVESLPVTAKTVDISWSNVGTEGTILDPEVEWTPLPEEIPLLFEPSVYTVADNYPLLSEVLVTLPPDGPPQGSQSFVTRISNAYSLLPEGTSAASPNGALKESLSGAPVTVLPAGPSLALQTASSEISEEVGPPLMTSITSPALGPNLENWNIGFEELDTTSTLEEALPSTPETPPSGTSSEQPFLTTIPKTTSRSTLRPESGLEDLEKLESEEERDKEDEEDEETEESEEEESHEDQAELVSTPTPSFSHTPYRLPSSSQWVQHNQGLVRSWVEKIRDKAGYVSGMLAPVGIGIAGALFILGALYSIKVMHRKRRSSFKRERRKRREMSSRQDRVMLLADSSEDEF